MEVARGQVNAKNSPSEGTAKPPLQAEWENGMYARRMRVNREVMEEQEGCIAVDGFVSGDGSVGRLGKGGSLCEDRVRAAIWKYHFRTCAAWPKLLYNLKTLLDKLEAI